MKNYQYKAILQYINEFNGATIDANTGDIALLDAGYMVSVAGYEKRVKKLTFRGLQKAQKTAQSLGGFLGLWIDNGYIYIDVSLCFDNLATAYMIGRKNEQIAIFDNANKISIYLK